MGGLVLVKGSWHEAEMDFHHWFFAWRQDELAGSSEVHLGGWTPRHGRRFKPFKKSLIHKTLALMGKEPAEQNQRQAVSVLGHTKGCQNSQLLRKRAKLT